MFKVIFIHSYIYSILITDLTMNILLITQLYPLAKESIVSPALHYFVKVWAQQHKVQIIRLFLPNEKEPPPVSDQITYDSVKVDIVRGRWIPVVKKVYINKTQVRNLITQKPDVIICHLYNSYFTFSYLKNYFRVPLIIGIHRSDVLISKYMFHRYRIKKAIQKADLLVYRSGAVKINFEKYHHPASDSFIAFSGIPEKLAARSKDKLRTERSSAGIKKVISACTLLKLKQLDKVIIALNTLKTKGFNWEYTIIGDGPEKQYLEKLVHKLNLSTQVFFMGRLPRDEVFSYMEQHDFFAMPSYNETFGLAFLEAMANGCIVIGAKGWGIDGFVTDGVNGFLCNPYDQEDINQKVLSALTMDDKNLDEIRKNSLLTVSNCSDETMAEKYLARIKECSRKYI
jgi:L-malate glycosyltransferase